MARGQHDGQVEGRVRCLAYRLLVQSGELEAKRSYTPYCVVSEEEGRRIAAKTPDDALRAQRTVGPKILRQFRERFGPYHPGNALRPHDV